ncbi:glycoside hydrolase family 32 protein [Clavibacter sp. VKM Ac-2872]|uniref:glycoside hydrolase family 32 protein n=1 Tax=Clavibacter sp. VKM Ac-2872 TaxID=2783812 RepID=UPI00351B3DF9
MSATDALVPRPRFHFTPRRNWMNDPNGLVHHAGLWHLFFQYNPHGADWGNMSWGHATSPDLERWTEHPVAIMHRPGEQIFSGSVVASSPGSSELTALYTSAYDDDHQAQSRATSTDGGMTWTPDPRNPVLDRGTSSFRDPKVIRVADAAGHARWVLLAVEAEERRVIFYSSTDLLSWEPLSDFGPHGEEGVVWECPDLVPLAVDGDPDHVAWVLTFSTNPVDGRDDPGGSSMSYVVGDFDGRTFTSATPDPLRLDHGTDFYAGVTFADAPDAAVVMLGWMSNWRYAAAIPSTPWRGAMSLPRTLSLTRTAAGPRLVQRPPASLVERLAEHPPLRIAAHAPATRLDLGDHFLLGLAWDSSRPGTSRLHLRGTADAFAVIELDASAATLTVTRGGPAMAAVHPDLPATTTAPLPDGHGGRMLVSVDGPLLEVFVDGGIVASSHLVLLGTGGVTVTLSSDAADVELTVADRVGEPASA